MGMLGAFIGGVAKTRLADMQAKDEEESALRRLEKQEEIREKMRQKAEESRIAAKKLFKQKGTPSDQGPMPDQFMVEEFNGLGRPVGTRLASPSEAYDAQQTEQATALAQQQAQALATRQAEAHANTMANGEARRARDAERAALDATKRNNPGAFNSRGGSKAKGDGMDEVLKEQNEINLLLRNKDFRDAVEATDPGALQELGMKDDDKIVKGLKLVAGAFGVKSEGKDESQFQKEFDAEQDPAVKAQMLKSRRLRLQQAAMAGRSLGFGLATPKS